MSLQDRFIEQCTAEEVLASVLDAFLKPASKVTENMGYELESGKKEMVSLLALAGIQASVTEGFDSLVRKVKQTVGLVNTATFSKALPFTLGSLLINNDYSIITSIDDDSITTIPTLVEPTVLQRATNMGRVHLANFVSGCLAYAVNYATPSYLYAKALHIEKYRNTIYDLFRRPTEDRCYLVNTRHLKGCKGTGSRSGNHHLYMDYLYDWQMSDVGEIDTSTNCGLWTSSTVLSSSSASLCDTDEWDDELEKSGDVQFSTNLQKFLWYFEHHFIPCLADVTTEPTLSLASGVYNAINATYSTETPTKTLKELIEDKGWTVASV